LGTLLSTIGVPFEFALPPSPRGRVQYAPTTQLDGTPYLELIAGNLPVGTMTTPTIVALPDLPTGFPALASDSVGRGLVPRRPGTALTPTLSQTEREQAIAVQHPTPNTQHPTHHSSLDSVFAVLARSEEYTVTTRDQYERFSWAHTTAQPAEAAVRPLVSEYAQRLLATIKETAAQAGLPLIRKEIWPHAKPMAACLTHDVDAIRRGKLPRGVAGRDVRAAICTAMRGRLGQAAGQAVAIARTASGSNPYWTFDRIAAMEREHGFRSTYFVMAGPLHPQDAPYEPSDPKVAGLIHTLADSGCEIALHGSFASYTDAESLKVQKARLEAVLGAKVSGHRNHVLRLRVPDSWRVHQAAGFSYDATLGFADHEGYRGGCAFPFHPYDTETDQPLDLLEIPLAVMDVTIHKYRGLRGGNAWQAVAAVLEQTMAVNGLATLLWHNDTLYEPDFPGCGRLYEAALDWLAARDAWVATCADVDRWWRARDKVRLLPLQGEKIGWEMETGDAIDGLVLRLSLHDPRAAPRVSSPNARVRRDSPDYLLEFGSLCAGSRVEIRC